MSQIIELFILMLMRMPSNQDYIVKTQVSEGIMMVNVGKLIALENLENGDCTD